MRRVSGLLCAVAIIVGSMSAAAADTPVAYSVSRARAPLESDGELGDPAWRGALPVGPFVAPGGGGERLPPSASRARLLWDDEYLYFLAELDDREMVVAATADDDRLWLGDVFELFFKPNAGDPGYYEFQVNPANARLDIYLPHRANDAYSRWRSSRRFDWQTAVGKTSTGWTVEGRIPWRDFAVNARRPKPGDIWRFALCRYDYGADAEPALSCNARLTQPSFHRHEEWAELRFVEQ